MVTNPIQIHVFAVLKTYFEPAFTVDFAGNTVSELIFQLSSINPESKNVLSISRYAQNNVFLHPHDRVDPNLPIYIIPPSSGG
jgi:molybdopterin converting factor small subunit